MRGLLAPLAVILIKDVTACGECVLFTEGKGVKDTAIFGEKGWGVYFRRAMI